MHSANFPNQHFHILLLPIMNKLHGQTNLKHFHFSVERNADFGKL